MLIEFDPVKDEQNMGKHGVSLALAGLLNWLEARIRKDTRHDYSEDRYQAFATLEERLYFVVFTLRNSADGVPAMRVISVRKANRKEVKDYEAGS
jgi:uncharacterized DUF497 family protein